MHPVLDDLADGLHTGRPGQLTSSPRARRSRRRLREHGDDEPALGPRSLGAPACRGATRWSMQIASARGISLAERLAARTLELVDMLSQSLHEEAIRGHVRSLVPEGWTAETELEDAALYAPSRREGVPFVVLAGHYDTVPPQDNIPGR